MSTLGSASRIASTRAGTSARTPVDCAYQFVVAVGADDSFDTRRQFFDRAHASLAPGGTLALADPVLPAPQAALPTWLRVVLWMMMRGGAAPWANFVSKDEYAAELRAAGFDDVAVQDISSDVFPGLAEFISGRTPSARDGTLAAGKEKMVGIAWEGIGRSSLGWAVSSDSY